MEKNTFHHHLLLFLNELGMCQTKAKMSYSASLHKFWIFSRLWYLDFIFKNCLYCRSAVEGSPCWRGGTALP